MRMLYLLPALALVAGTLPAAAAQQQSTPSTSSDENGGTPARPKPQKICRKDEAAASYSRMTRTVCHTQAEWDDIDARKVKAHGSQQ